MCKGDPLPRRSVPRLPIHIPIHIPIYIPIYIPIDIRVCIAIGVISCERWRRTT